LLWQAALLPLGDRTRGTAALAKRWEKANN
jgi:hypothetical protein